MSWDCHSLSIHFLCHSPVSLDSSLLFRTFVLIIDPSVFSYPPKKRSTTVTTVYGKPPNPWCVVRKKKKQKRWRYVTTESSTAKLSMCLGRWFPGFWWSHGRPWPLNRAGEVIASRSRIFGFWWGEMLRSLIQNGRCFFVYFVRFIAWIYTKNRYYIQIFW